MTAIAVEDKQPVGPYCTSLCVSVEVLYPLKAKLISRPAIVANSNNPARWKALIPAYLVELSL